MFVFPQDAAFRQYSLRCLLSQDVLLQEDVELIELLDPSVLSLGSTDTVCPSASAAVPAPCYLSSPSIWYTPTSIPTKTPNPYQADILTICFFVIGMCPFWSGCLLSCSACAFRTLTTSRLCGCVPSWCVLCVRVAVCLCGVRQFYSATSSL